VGVGPIHAGVIEPGHFRFICNGEQILHLEIQLGYQHRGMESLFLEKKKILQRITLAENIAGDSVAGHTTAFVNLWESLCGFQPGRDLQFSRTLALELERIAIHTGDLSAMCTDVGYQLGNAVLKVRPAHQLFSNLVWQQARQRFDSPGLHPLPVCPSLSR
jgi:Ni,Fe-hydrogenase III large subunit